MHGCCTHVYIVNLQARWIDEWTDSDLQASEDHGDVDPAEYIGDDDGLAESNADEIDAHVDNADGDGVPSHSMVDRSHTNLSKFVIHA